MMGKHTGPKSHPSDQSSGQMLAFFPPSPSAASQTVQEPPITTMALGGEENGAQTLPITKNKLVEIKEDLKLHLVSLTDKKLDPLVEQISSFSSTIKEVANAAYEESEKNRGLIKELKATE